MALPYMLADGPSRKLGPKALTAWWAGIMVIGGLRAGNGGQGRVSRDEGLFRFDDGVVLSAALRR